MTEKKASRAGYRLIAERLKEKIESGDYPVGKLMPSYEAIAAEHGVSKNVARDAVALLEHAGIAERAAGIGTTVLCKPSEAPPSEREQLMQQIASMRERIEQVAGEVAELRREVHEGPQPPAPTRRAGQPASRVRP